MKEWLSSWLAEQPLRGPGFEPRSRDFDVLVFGISCFQVARCLKDG